MVESQNIIKAFEEYVPLLHGIMTNRRLQREAKLGAVTAIGDTFLMTKEKFLPFLEETLRLFSSAAEQCVDVNVNDDDLVEYVIKLQGALIESYTCIIQEASNSNEEAYKKVQNYPPNYIHQLIEVYVEGIVKFCII